MVEHPMRATTLTLLLLLAACTAPAPRPLALAAAPTLGWYCPPCSRIPRRVALDAATLELGATAERRAACRANR